MKTTLEEKLRCVKLHLNEGVPIYEIQEKYGMVILQETLDNHIKTDVK